MFQIAVGAQSGTGGRTLLTSDLNLYVNASTGNDSNNGLTPGTAKLTIQAAIDLLNNYDGDGWQAIINLANGTYPAGWTFNGPYVGFNNGIQLVGGSGVTIQDGGFVQFQQVTITGGFNQEGASAHGVQADQAGKIVVDGINWGVCSQYQLFSAKGGQISFQNTNYTIYGGARGHCRCDETGTLNNSAGMTVTLTGTPAFSVAFCQSTRDGALSFAGATFSGSASAGTTKFNVSSGGAILTTAARTYLPGGKIGVVSSGGTYS